MTSCSQCASAVEEGVAGCVQCGTAIDQETIETQQHVPAWPGSVEPAVSARKFGGWLIPVALSLAISLLLRLQGVYVNLTHLWSSRYRAILAAMPTVSETILYQAITNSILLAAMIGLNVLFYRKRKTFPGLMITYLIGKIVPIMIDALLVQGFKPVAGLAVFLETMPAMILIPYYLRSERVKLTFVN